ncbi:conserved hypothetical protein [Candidatus Zixiibacteriota bacterium]|nr:conserved hypothetical protein [candidate division Zixibacteria bacterium]
MRRGKKNKSPIGINLDLFDPLPKILPNETPVAEATAAILPTGDELYNIFNRLNVAHFGGILPPVKISYSGKMLMAGSYTPARREIKIGLRYHRIFPSEIEDTLKHEMLHIVNPSHNRAFKAEARRIGASVKARSHPSLRAGVRYIYVCPACGREYPRRKRLRLASCGVCSSGGKFDSRFKLSLKKGTKKGNRGV